jgi:hypothetical protein
MSRFFRLLKPIAGQPILDVGGGPGLWREAGYGGPVVFLNIIPPEQMPALPPGCRYVRGDGRELPFGYGEFAIVFSNSVIEHVGDWASQQRFAREIQRVGRRYWVQTPNRHFPIEPHLNFPGFQWLPDRLARVVVATWPLSYHRRDGLSSDQAWNAIQRTRLVTVAEMRQLFPASTIWRERFLGLTKSIVAYRA